MKIIAPLLFFLAILSSAGVFAKSKNPWIQRSFEIGSNDSCTGSPFDGDLIIPSHMNFVAFADAPVSLYIKNQNGALLKSSYSPGRMINISFVAMEPFSLLICRVYNPQPQQNNPQPNQQGGQAQQQTQNNQPPVQIFISSN